MEKQDTYVAVQATREFVTIHFPQIQWHHSLLILHIAHNEYIFKNNRPSLCKIFWSISRVSPLQVRMDLTTVSNITNVRMWNSITFSVSWIKLNEICHTWMIYFRKYISWIILIVQHTVVPRYSYFWTWQLNYHWNERQICQLNFINLNYKCA